MIRHRVHARGHVARRRHLLSVGCLSGSVAHLIRGGGIGHLVRVPGVLAVRRTGGSAEIGGLHALHVLALHLSVRIPVVHSLVVVHVVRVLTRGGVRGGRRRGRRRLSGQIGGAVRIARLLAPETFDRMPVDLGVVHCLDGGGRRLFRGELDERVALVAERSDLHDRAETREHLFHQLLGQALDDAAAVHRTVGGAGLVVHVVERDRPVAAVLVGRPGRRRLPRRPVGPDAAAAQPLAVHRVDRVLRVRLFHERHERVALGLERLRVAHYATVGDLAERRERLLQRVRLDLGAQVAHEYVIMVAGVQLGLVPGRRGPIDFHLFVQEQPAVHRGQRRGRARVRVELEERVRVAARLAYHFGRVHRPDVREQRAQQLLRDGRVQVADVQRTGIALLAHFYKKYILFFLLSFYNTYGETVVSDMCSTCVYRINYSRTTIVTFLRVVNNSRCTIIFLVRVSQQTRFA